MEFTVFIHAPFALRGPTLAGLASALATGAALAAAPAPGTANNDAMTLCRALVNDQQRLACFDRALPPLLPLAAPAAVGAAPAKPSMPAVPAVPAVVTETPAQASGVASQPSAQPSAEVAQFGLPRRASDQAQQLSSQVLGAFNGWSPGQRIALANGQLWEVTDNSVGAYRLQSPKVTIGRGAFGSFFMQIDGVQQTPKVRRVK